MHPLLSYLNDLPPAEQAAFATRCGTSVGYLRKAVSAGQKLGESLVINLERESSARVRCEEVRPDVDWAYLRNSADKAISVPAHPAPTNPPAAQAAQQGVANA